jgi:hypothetical protein
MCGVAYTSITSRQQQTQAYAPGILDNHVRLYRTNAREGTEQGQGLFTYGVGAVRSHKRVYQKGSRIHKPSKQE